MNEVELAGAFANVVGLVCNFVQSRAAGEGASRQQFVEWLQYHRHTELAEQIAGSVGLQREIDTLLRKNHGELLTAIQSANEMIASVLSRLDAFMGISKVFVPNKSVSEQAMFFLHQLANSEHQEIIVTEILETPVFDNGEGVSFFSDQCRFISDDLDTLFTLGLLSRSQNSHSHLVHKLTRAGMSFLKASSWVPPHDEDSE